MLGGGAGWDAQIVRRAVLDDERQGHVVGLEAERLPGDALAIGAGTAAVAGTLDRDAGLPQPVGLGVEPVGEEGVVDGALALGQLRPPLVILRRIGHLEGDQLEVGAVAEGDEGVVGGASRVLAAGGDGESRFFVVGRGLGQVVDGDDDVIDRADHDLLRSFPLVIVARAPMRSRVTLGEVSPPLRSHAPVVSRMRGSMKP